jgi:WD40 repeat protein
VAIDTNHRRNQDGGIRYDGFISYSHAADGKLAPRLQAGLQQFAKPWWRRRAVRIFRDESSLSANPHLWSSIETALQSSDWFVLLLSPEAAASPWVDREVAWWREHKDPNRILPVLTDGELLWDEQCRTLDAKVSSAVPPSLIGAFADEPRWIDLRWARVDTDLDLRHTGFRGAVADVASAIRRIPKEDLESEEVRQHRRTKRTAWGAALLLAILTLTSVVAALYANSQRLEAESQTRIAEGRGLAARATALADTRLDLSLLLAVEGLRTDESLETRAGLLTALDQAQYLTAFRHLPADALTFDIHGESGVMALLTELGEVQAWSLSEWQPIGPALGSVGTAISVDVSADGTHIAASGSEGATVWNVATGEQFGPASRPEEGPVYSKLSPTGDLLLTTDVFDPVWHVHVWELPTGRLIGRLDFGNEPGFGGADFSPDGSRIYASAAGGRAGVFDSHTLQPLVEPSVLDVPTSWGPTVSPQGDLVAVSSVSPVQINILDAETLEPVGNPIVPRMGGRLYVLAFSPDGSRLLAQTDDGSVAVIDGAQSIEVATVTGRSGFGAGAEWLDSNRFMSMSESTVMEWDLQRTSSLARPVAASEGFVPTTDDTLVTVDYEGALRWSTADGASATFDLRMPCFSVSLSPDRRFAAAGCEDGDGPVLAIVDLVASVEIHRLSLEGAPLAVEFSPTSEQLAIAGTDGHIRVWDVSSGEAVFAEHLDSWLLGAVGWTPEGSTLVTGGQHGSLFFYNTTTWVQEEELVLEPIEIALMGLAIHPDGRRAYVASESGVVWVVDLQARSIDGEPLDASGTQLQGVAVSLDGTTVAATSRDGGLRLWEVESRRAIGPTLKGHALTADGVAFGPSGLYTSGIETISTETGGWTGSTVRWTLDVAELTELACRLVGRNLTQSEWAEFVPDSDYRVTCNDFPSQ